MDLIFEVQIMKPSLCRRLHSSVTSFQLGQNIVLITLFEHFQFMFP